MAYRPSELNSSWSAFGWRRSLILKLLLTAFWTALLAAAGLYGFKLVLEREPAAPEAPVAAEPVTAQDDEALPAPERLPLADAGNGSAPSAGSLALVKKGKLPEDPGPDAVSRAARPRLRPVSFGGSGGNFASPGFGEETGAPAPARRRNLPEGVILNQAALAKKIKVKGARPVPAGTAKRYSGMDPESEALRFFRQRQTEARAESFKQLRREQLLLSGLILLSIVALMVAGSRVIHALRLIEKPDGPHWTLK
ncbi:MAG: hypothetical protein CVT66_10875 [Actinobacteria bacterium HGW-Actinobacteria-6]|jgi:hypothetical protein|nr:MAG: hypothetical protein CVT66_10875 [Actinobacteria bacterium HGW-Actinobacteria-6]